MPKRPNPYAQVALTYLRRPFSSVRAGVMILAVMFITYIAVGDPASRHFNREPSQVLASRIPLLVQAVVAWFILFAVHVKDQFADPRAHLLPSFRRAHIVVASVATLILAVLLPAVLTAWFGLHSIGLMAIMAAWFGMVFWGVLMQSRLITWLMAIAFFVGLSWGRDAAAELCSGRCEPEAVGIWAISLVAILLGGLRLICLNEDMPEYHRRMATGWSGKGQATGGEQMLPRGLRDRFQAIQMAGLTRHVRRSAVSRWSRICRWQVGMMTGWSGLLYAGTFLLLFSVMTFSHSGNRKPSPSISMPVVFFTIMSVSMVWGALWRRRTRTLPFEFLLPVDRATYLKQVGLAAALNQCQLWIAFCAIAIPWQWIVAPQSSFLLASLLGYSFLCQVGLFGVGAWLLRLRSPTLAFLGFMVAIQVLMFSTVAMEHGPLASCRHIVFWAAGGFAVCGLLLTWAAYRRWLAADID